MGKARQWLAVRTHCQFLIHPLYRKVHAFFWLSPRLDTSKTLPPKVETVNLCSPLTTTSTIKANTISEEHFNLKCPRRNAKILNPLSNLGFRWSKMNEKCLCPTCSVEMKPVKGKDGKVLYHRCPKCNCQVLYTKFGH